MQWLWENGDLTIGELSTKIYLACSTTTDLIDRMEKKQLVMRVKDPKDRRVVRIHLLEEGERIIEEVIYKRQNYLKDRLVNFNDDKLSALEKGLIQLQHDMREE